MIFCSNPFTQEKKPKNEIFSYNRLLYISPLGIPSGEWGKTSPCGKWGNGQYLFVRYKILRGSNRHRQWYDFWPNGMTYFGFNGIDRLFFKI